MGKNPPPQRSQSRVTNLSLKSDFILLFLRRVISGALLPCAIFTSLIFTVSAQIKVSSPNEVPAQTAFLQNADYFSQILKKGTTEQKRNVLLEIRNSKLAEASQIALPALKDSSEIVRATAVSAVVFLPSEEAARNLLPLLNDKKVLVRRETAFALGLTRSKSAIEPLIKEFQKDKISEVKNACVVALGEIGDASAIAFLTKILQKSPRQEDDADEFLRRSAAHSIGQIAEFLQTGKIRNLTPENLLINDSKLKSAAPHKNLATFSTDFALAVSVLINTLKNTNEAAETKRESAFALGSIADDSAVSVLQSNLSAPDYYLARICEESLAKIQSVSINKSSPAR